MRFKNDQLRLFLVKLARSWILKLKHILIVVPDIKTEYNRITVRDVPNKKVTGLTPKLLILVRCSYHSIFRFRY